jgi:hypothetical protein
MAEYLHDGDWDLPEREFDVFRRRLPTVAEGAGYFIEGYGSEFAYAVVPLPLSVLDSLENIHNDANDRERAELLADAVLQTVNEPLPRQRHWFDVPGGRNWDAGPNYVEYYAGSTGDRYEGARLYESNAVSFRWHVPAIDSDISPAWFPPIIEATNSLALRLWERIGLAVDKCALLAVLSNFGALSLRTEDRFKREERRRYVGADIDVLFADHPFVVTPIELKSNLTVDQLQRTIEALFELGRSPCAVNRSERV